MTNAENFIDLVGKLYNLPEKQILQMQNNVPEIDAEFDKYYWDDIKNKVNLFYARKNDKSRPRVCQILAMLEADPNINTKEEEPEPVVSQWHRPHTKLFTIADTFNKLVDVLMAGGVMPNEMGEYVNKRSLVDPETDDVILDPQQWLKNKLAQAKMQKPECFIRFQYATPLEQIAVAIQNNLIVFKVRDWAKQAKKVGGIK